MITGRKDCRHDQRQGKLESGHSLGNDGPRVCQPSFRDEIKTRGGQKLRRLKDCVTERICRPWEQVHAPPKGHPLPAWREGGPAPQSLPVRVGAPGALLTGGVLSGLGAGALWLEAFREISPFSAVAAPVDRHSR